MKYRLTIAIALGIIGAVFAWYPFIRALIIHQKIWWMELLVILGMTLDFLGVYLSGKKEEVP